MKCILIFVSLVCYTLAADHYTTKYDNVNIDNILGNNRLFSNYINCLLDKGRCTEDGKTLKEVVPDALITNCVKCNDKQRESVKKVVSFLVKNRRKDYDALVAKYDPQGIYRENYKHYLDDLN